MLDDSPKEAKKIRSKCLEGVKPQKKESKSEKQTQKSKSKKGSKRAEQSVKIDEEFRFDDEKEDKIEVS